MIIAVYTSIFKKKDNYHFISGEYSNVPKNVPVLTDLEYGDKKFIILQVQWIEL
jgi:hypothetical protein